MRTGEEVIDQEECNEMKWPKKWKDVWWVKKKVDGKKGIRWPKEIGEYIKGKRKLMAPKMKGYLPVRKKSGWSKGIKWPREIGESWN